MPLGGMSLGDAKNNERKTYHLPGFVLYTVFFLYVYENIVFFINFGGNCLDSIFKFGFIFQANVLNEYINVQNYCLHFPKFLIITFSKFVKDQQYRFS